MSKHTSSKQAGGDFRGLGDLGMGAVDRRGLRRAGVGLIGLVALLAGTPAVGAVPQSPQTATSRQTATQPTDMASVVWGLSRGDAPVRDAAFAEPIRKLDGIAGGAAGDGGGADLRAAVAALDTALAKRETDRAEQIGKVEKQLEEALAKEPTGANLSAALTSVVALHELSADKKALLAQDRIKALMQRAADAAREAEGKGDWLIANELFVRLHVLTEVDGTYKPDMRRIGDRLQMLRLYAPERLWELRNQRREIERATNPKLTPLPAFNNLGDSFGNKLKGITKRLVVQAISSAGSRHIERRGHRSLLVGALDAARTMATTHDLANVFPGLADKEKVAQFLAVLDQQTARIRAMKDEPTAFEVEPTVDAILAASGETVSIPEAALLHELGNGAFDRLDEFSQILWPDEMPRLLRVMDGDFVGVGVQIQMDEASQMIKVVAPLEGTPAANAGIRTGDLIKRIDGQNAVGISTDQAVNLITGQRGTKVVVTMERDGEEMDFELTRDRIQLVSVKGWERSGERENDWNWFIDKDRRIGYARVTTFQKGTAAELRRAIGQMRQQGGLNGLILDLRFNGGGLLDQAVELVNLFVDEGTVVYTEGFGGQREQTHSAMAGRSVLRDVPITVLVNEGSASASEIVAGAIRHYADRGVLPARIVGTRTFGKGSVQNVTELPGRSSLLKLTQAYYFLPNGRLIHRRDHATEWGVEPHVRVEMLPNRISEALLLRQDADLSPAVLAMRKEAEAKLAAKRAADKATKGGQPDPAAKPDVAEAPAEAKSPDPDRLLSEGLDLQLKTALLLLQTQAGAKQTARAG